jgi:hypothetical protein
MAIELNQISRTYVAAGPSEAAGLMVSSTAARADEPKRRQRGRPVRGHRAAA